MPDRPNDLIALMATALAALEASEHARRTDLSHLLCYSARHVSATEFGRDLERRRLDDQNATCAAVGVDAATLEVATLTMILASAVTVLDLCASALWWWADPDAKSYADAQTVQETAEEAHVVIPSPLLSWLHKTEGSHHYRPLKEFRNTQIHRMPRQDATVFARTVTAVAGVPGSPPEPEEPDKQSRPASVVTVGSDPTKPTTHERGALANDVATFTTVRWSAFWRLFEDPAALVCTG